MSVDILPPQRWVAGLEPKDTRVAFMPFRRWTVGVLVTVSMVISSVGALAARESVSFKGDAVGTDLFSFCKKYDRLLPGSGWRAPGIRFGVTSTSETPEKFDLRAKGAMIVSKKMGFEELNETIAGFPATRVEYWFYAKDLADYMVCNFVQMDFNSRFAAAKEWSAQVNRPISISDQPPWENSIGHSGKRVFLGRILVSFDVSHFETVMKALTEKYGLPTMHLPAGLDYVKISTGEVFRWEIGSERIDAVSHSMRTQFAEYRDVAQVHFYRPALEVPVYDLTRIPTTPSGVVGAGKDL